MENYSIEKSSKKKKAMRLTRKYKLIMACGGGCSKCGYNKNISALVFHHLDEKNIALNGAMLGMINIKSINEELEKCLLLCHNCHHELHNPNADMKNVAKAVQALIEKKMTLVQTSEKYFSN